MPDEKPELQVGDVLIYTGLSFFDWVIRLKRGTFACHTEVYIGDGMSVASRNWPTGVGKYPVRWNGLYRVYRPIRKFDLAAAMKWFYSKGPNGEPAPCGQGYDVLGLFCFTFAAWQGSKTRMFCSEFARKFLNAGGIEPFNPDFGSDHVAPDHYETSIGTSTFWKAP